MTSYLTTDDAAKLLRISTRALRDRIARREVPHRRLPGMRRVLFDAAELAAFVDRGGELEEITVPGGGRVVRLRERTAP